MATCIACGHFYPDGSKICGYCKTDQRNWKEKVKDIWKLWALILCLTPIIVAGAIILQSWNLNRQTGIIKSSFELENRPFVSIEDVYWGQAEGSPWFISGFKMENYGSKPAQEFSLRNVKAIIFNLDKAALIEKLNQEHQSISEQYFQEYLSDLKNKIYWETSSLLADYFYNHPKANKVDTENFINSRNDVLGEDSKLKHNGSLLLSVIEVNNDMFDYFSRGGQLVYPNQKNIGRKYNQQMGEGGIAGVKRGDNFLILYWSNIYRGLTDELYSTNYIGYYANSGATITGAASNAFYPLREFKSWSVGVKMGDE
ncbi:hypothetical protein ACFL1I_08230 [Candidatus Omnitrophota bacterium]